MGRTAVLRESHDIPLQKDLERQVDQRDADQRKQQAHGYRAGLLFSATAVGQQQERDNGLHDNLDKGERRATIEAAPSFRLFCPPDHDYHPTKGREKINEPAIDAVRRILGRPGHRLDRLVVGLRNVVGTYPHKRDIGRHDYRKNK